MIRNKTFYKTIALLLALVAVLSLAGCGGTDKPGETDGPDGPGVSDGSGETGEPNGSGEAGEPGEPGEPDETVDPGNTGATVEDFANIDMMNYVADMGMGINLGNEFDSTGDYLKGSSVTHVEIAWGSPVITQAAIEEYARAGFGVMRLPVSWLTLADDEGNIPEEFMDRIEQVVGWILDSGMYCILNTHHDGWTDKFPEDYDGAMAIYQNVWEQICERFEPYGPKLMFESMNEVGFDGIWNRYAGNKGKQEAFDMFNSINQKFVDIVRASGENNAQRPLLIASYWTDSEIVVDEMFVLPEDPVNRMAVSIHYYTPSTLCILEADADWGKAKTDWGSDSDYAQLNRIMDAVKERFIDNDIPVIVGEYGCFGSNKTREVRTQWELDVAAACCERQMCPVLWDTAGDEFDRLAKEFRDPEFIERLLAVGNSQ